MSVEQRLTEIEARAKQHLRPWTLSRADFEWLVGQVRGLLAEIEALRAANDVWMNGVADAVEPFGYDRQAASGPADLLPGLTELRGLYAIVKDLAEMYPLWGRVCCCCDEIEPPLNPRKSTSHIASCPWRRAVEAMEAQ